MGGLQLVLNKGFVISLVTLDTIFTVVVIPIKKTILNWLSIE